MGIMPCIFKVNETGRELELRGTPMFPFGVYRSYIYSDGLSDIPWHWHDEIELILVESGSLLLKFSDISVTLEKGEGAFINSGVIHSLNVNNNNSCIVNSFVFHPTFIYGNTENIILQKYIRPLLNSHNLLYIKFNNKIVWQSQILYNIESAYISFKNENFGYEMAVWENLSGVFNLIIKNMEGSLISSKKNEDVDTIRIKKMITFIHEFYGENIELKQIANIVNISERECLRCFNSIIGTSPIQYLIKYRISIAASLLRETNQSITEICNKCGFISPSYFSKLFKKFIGATPKEYRKIPQ